ncbi:hypothetical protein H5P28_08660 [Ruficoccus amylovorans]|uniref:Peptidase C1A papain C-terminal domain-containing protein n=1 Tax=Ruficoccus amylovorans TaxID=1804625 RepID=A0A842HD32_9BACT|nr:C1 family peptidase [Ruficoccus amylovorans]MBC2594332.1 hypothetical protein [Ruficoccus amylovorans]
MKIRVLLKRCLLIGVSLSLGAGWFARAADYPSAYDLRSHGLLTAVKNQQDLGDCWAFASTTAFEGSLLKRGLMSGPTDPSGHLSPWHLATRSGTEPSLTPQMEDGHLSYENWGANFYHSIGYYTRGRGAWDSPTPDSTIPQLGGGPVLTSSNSLNAYPSAAAEAYEDLSPYVPPADQPTAFGVKQAVFINQGQHSASTQINRIKDGLLTFGALGTAIYMDQSIINKTDWTYIYTGSESTDHDVAIVGWDDSKVVSGASSTGAWLIQNSWGSDWGDGGYFWISYEDAHAGKSSTMAIEAMSMENYSQTVLQNQYFYADNYLQIEELSTMSAAAILTVAEAGMLDAIGIITGAENMTVRVSIYTSWDDVTNAPEDLLITTTDTLELIGYHLIELSEELAYEAGDEIVVIVEYDSDSIYYDAKSEVNAGVSYYYDGSEWVDLASENTPGTFFAKGLMLVPEPAHWAALAGLIVLGVLVWRKRDSRVRLAGVEG